VVYRRLLMHKRTVAKALYAGHSPKRIEYAECFMFTTGNAWLRRNQAMVEEDVHLVPTLCNRVVIFTACVGLNYMRSPDALQMVYQANIKTNQTCFVCANSSDLCKSFGRSHF
jgi:hypothetical protein